MRIHKNVPLGMNKFSHPIVPGQGMRVEMIRDEEVILVCDSLDDSNEDRLRFGVSPKSYNFNAFVCMSG